MMADFPNYYDPSEFESDIKEASDQVDHQEWNRVENNTQLNRDDIESNKNRLSTNENNIQTLQEQSFIWGLIFGGD